LIHIGCYRKSGYDDEQLIKEPNERTNVFFQKPFQQFNSLFTFSFVWLFIFLLYEQGFSENMNLHCYLEGELMLHRNLESEGEKKLKSSIKKGNIGIFVNL